MKNKIKFLTMLLCFTAFVSATSIIVYAIITATVNVTNTVTFHAAEQVEATISTTSGDNPSITFIDGEAVDAKTLDIGEIDLTDGKAANISIIIKNNGEQTLYVDWTAATISDTENFKITGTATSASENIAVTKGGFTEIIIYWEYIGSNLADASATLEGFTISLDLENA